MDRLEADAPPPADHDLPYDVVIRNARVFDGRAELPGPRNVGIRGHAIAAVSETPLQGRIEIDGDGGWLMPGLIDTHIHLLDFSVVTDPDSLSDYVDNVIPLTLDRFLQNGITSVKSVGDPTTEILALRARLSAGSLRGPRLFVTGSSITGRDGHPVSTVFGGNRWYAARAVGEVDSAQMMRDLVHHLADQRVDAIKLVSEGACCIPGSPQYVWQNPVFPAAVELVRLPRQILRAGIEAAHERRLRVTVHTVQQDAAIEAVEAGADGLEHGITVEPITDPRLLDMIRDRGVVYTPTLWIKGEMHPTSIPNTRVVMDAGVRIACGSDSFPGRGAFGENTIEEAELLVAAGMSTSQVLVAATSEAARHLDRSDIGTLAPGKSADMILLAGNPVEDISNLRKLRLTILNGEIVVDRR
ncbi:amidohydrolase family protein [Sphingomonas sp. SRS2]|uniref:amidohydrolase family protein n=1 Tax=Sphingomonas sp. SRS2 TaxID=133190 RepID=UPI00061843EF|nr:amidohydrolase family protein [Sphingomonas sp. SRS2]KKC27222.1 amidohydrolase [Sphingomonas sp. SRS2]